MNNRNSILSTIIMLIMITFPSSGNQTNFSSQWTQLFEDDRRISNYPRLFRHSLFSDISADRILLLGEDIISANTEVWSYDPSIQFWEVIYSVKDVRAMDTHSYVFDNKRNEIYETSVKGNTTEFNIYNITFGLQQTVQFPNEYISRNGIDLLYLTNEDAILISGGENPINSTYIAYFNDIWIYDIKTTLFEMIQIDNFQGRVNPAIAYNGDKGEILFFGGSYNDFETFDFQRFIYQTDYLEDTWILNLKNNTFEQIDSQQTPSLRDSSSIVYDPENKFYILFGGGKIVGEFNDTWIFNPESLQWSQLNLPSSPPFIEGATMIYDPNSQSTILYGGEGLVDGNDVTERYYNVWQFKIFSNSSTIVVTTKVVNDNNLAQFQLGIGVLAILSVIFVVYKKKISK